MSEDLRVAAHERFREVSDIARAQILQLGPEPAPGSPRADEWATFASAGEMGTARKDVQDRLCAEAMVMIGSLTLIVDGVADCLQVAETRDNRLNQPLFSMAVRSVLEVAGQIVWLLDPTIDGKTRVRRYLVWRFADLREQRLMARTLRTTPDPGSDQGPGFDDEEGQLIEMTEQAGWKATPTTTPGGHLNAAGLATSTGAKEQLPKIGSLVGEVAPKAVVYSVLSAASHGSRFGVIQGMDHQGIGADGRYQVTMTGFGLDSSLGLHLTLLALNRSCGLLMDWNGADAGPLDAAVKELAAIV